MSRALALVLLLGCGRLLLAEVWSGLIRIEEFETRPPAPPAEQAELQRYIADLEARLVRARRQLEASDPVSIEHDLLVQDVASFMAERRLAWERIGGSVPVGRRSYQLDRCGAGQGLVLVLGDGRGLRVDRAADRAEVVSVAGRERIGLAPIPDPVPLADQIGPAVIGRATRVHSIAVADERFRALVDPELPNPFALTLLASTPADSLVASLATLPGLPLRVTGEREGRGYTMQVQQIEPQAWAPDQMDLPALGGLE